MTKLGWIVGRVERIERITTLGYGFRTKGEAVAWGKEHLSSHPDECPEDIFILDDLNEPEERICITDLED